MEARAVKLLLIEADVEDAVLLKETLMEIEQRCCRKIWSPVFLPLHVERLSDALDVLAEEAFDLILVNVRLPDSHSLHAFLRLREAAPEAAILLLADSDDDGLAISALREGAQDVLLKGEIDAAPLARALRNALERQRVLLAANSGNPFDAETGLYHACAFHSLAEREFSLALQLGCDLQVALVRLQGFEDLERTYGRAETRLLRIGVAEALRSASDGVELLSAMSGGRFAAARLIPGPSSGAFARRLRSSFRNFCASSATASRLRVKIGFASLRERGARCWSDLYQAASEALCDNDRRTEPHHSIRQAILA